MRAARDCRYAGAFGGCHKSEASPCYLLQQMLGSFDFLCFSLRFVVAAWVQVALRVLR